MSNYSKLEIKNKLQGFLNERPFLLKEQIFDLNLEQDKMRKLKYRQEYTEGSIERIKLEKKINFEHPITKIKYERYNKKKHV